MIVSEQPITKRSRYAVFTLLFIAALAVFVWGFPAAKGTLGESQFEIKGFAFNDGEKLPLLKLHYITLGHPLRNAKGEIANAVLLLHGTGSSASEFLVPQFQAPLFKNGGPLDLEKYFIVIPDNIGHGESSKPSDGLHAHFPHYDYDDMVRAQYRLVSEGLHIGHLRLVLGTSMGCSHSWLWATQYPDFMDAVMPIACYPVQIGGRNRIWRKAIMDDIRNDPEWMNGDYKRQPQSLARALTIEVMAAQSALRMQEGAPTGESADALLSRLVEGGLKKADANNLLYAFDASRTYNPEPGLTKIKAHVMHVNFADDFINPPELGIGEREIKMVSKGTFVMMPITPQSHGHASLLYADLWKQYLQKLLQESSK